MELLLELAALGPPDSLTPSSSPQQPVLREEMECSEDPVSLKCYLSSKGREQQPPINKRPTRT